MDIEKTMEFILEQQAYCAALHAQHEARHAGHEARDAEHKAWRAEHDADIKEIRRLLLRSAAMRVEDRQEFRKHEREFKRLKLESAREMKELKQEIKAFVEEGRETKQVLKDFIRSLRGSSGNGSSHKK